MQTLAHPIRRTDLDTDSIIFQGIQPTPQGNSSVKDLTGWGFQILFHSVEDPTDAATAIGEVAADMSLANEGKIIFPMTSLTLPVGVVFLEVRSVDPDGKTKGQVQGEIRVSKGYPSTT